MPSLLHILLAAILPIGFAPIMHSHSKPSAARWSRTRKSASQYGSGTMASRTLCPFFVRQAISPFRFPTCLSIDAAAKRTPPA